MAPAIWAYAWSGGSSQAWARAEMLEEGAWHARNFVQQFERLRSSIALRGWRATLRRVAARDRRPTPEREVYAAPDGAIAATAGARMLVIDASTPVPSRDAGSLRLDALLRLLVEEGWQVDLFSHDGTSDAGDVARFAAMGVSLHGGSALRWLRIHGPQLRAVILSRASMAALYLHLVRRRAPRAAIVFDTVDLHFLREERAAQMLGRGGLLRRAAANRRRELQLVAASDLCLVVSEEEQSMLARALPHARIELLSTIHPVHGRSAGYHARRDLLFVGGFAHPPNLDAMRWFLAEVFPRVLEREPDLRVHVIGDLTAEARRCLDLPNVVLHGRVDDLADMMGTCRLSIAPLRFGAGVKGKVSMAMSHGLPVVATPVAAEAMHLHDGVDVLIARDAESFAAAILRAYRDAGLWLRLSDGGLANVAAHFSPDVARRTVRRLFPASGAGNDPC